MIITVGIRLVVTCYEHYLISVKYRILSTEEWRYLVFVKSSKNLTYLIALSCNDEQSKKNLDPDYHRSLFNFILLEDYTFRNSRKFTHKVFARQSDQ